MHRPGVVADRELCPAGDAGELEDRGTPGQIDGAGDLAGEAGFLARASDDRGETEPAQRLSQRGIACDRPALGRPVGRSSGNQERETVREAEARNIGVEP